MAWSDRFFNNPSAQVALALVLLWSEAHAEAGQVSVGEGEDDYEDDEPGVMIKQNGEVVTRRDVAQHEERDEDEPQAHQHRKPDTVFTRLDREMHGYYGNLQHYMSSDRLCKSFVSTLAVNCLKSTLFICWENMSWISGQMFMLFSKVFT